MKKQLLLLSMCLALSSASVLASCPQCQKAMPIPQSKNEMKQPPQQQKEARKAPSREEMKKRFEQRRTQEREQMYKELGLSAEQVAKAEALDVKTKLEVTPLIKKAKMEHKKLKDMIAKHEPYLAIRKQKQVTRAAKKEVYNYFKSSKAAFEAILTKEQVVKLKALHEQRMKKMEEMRKNHPQCKCKMKKFRKFSPCHCKPMRKMWGNPEEFGPFGPEMMGPPPIEPEHEMSPAPKQK